MATHADTGAYSGSADFWTRKAFSSATNIVILILVVVRFSIP